MTTHFLLTAWVWNPLAVLGAAAGLAAYLYWFGWSTRTGWMLTAAALFLLTLLSPVATLADGYLFSAHMTQHILLLLVVPALALMALPPGLRLPDRVERLLNPMLCWCCGVGAMWLWHVPTLCDAAAESRSVSAVQTVSLLVLGAAYWWQLLAPCESRRIPPLHGVGYLFAACAACTVLGIMLTFSPITVCRAYVHPVDRLGIGPMIYGEWGMTPLRDQQIGGLLMWVPMCSIYLCAIFGQLARWYAPPRFAT
ncbi:MAG TPA: cytochrome c oxidase assembly protein [Chthoniobacteraceae bacterium]|jgi:cytochrome c oxidase assembly factor CtaG|nr:cytochrome c oxidase assembly protein [Chthoniobacteraceae bacterium]